MVERSGRRRWVAAVSGALCAGFVLSASSISASARPAVFVGQSAPGVPSVAAAVGTSGSSHPSVSGDGRFVTYVGQPGGGDPAAAAADPRTGTVYLTDREVGTTVELTSVPEGLRSGNSLNPVLSGDGCNVVVVTELALDVFRDDDTGDRWDVYRRRLEHCGGVEGGWELVSTGAGGGSLARDDVSTVDPPAVSALYGEDRGQVHRIQSFPGLAAADPRRPGDFLKTVLVGDRAHKAKKFAAHVGGNLMVGRQQRTDFLLARHVVHGLHHRVVFARFVCDTLEKPGCLHA